MSDKGKNVLCTFSSTREMNVLHASSYETCMHVKKDRSYL